MSASDGAIAVWSLSAAREANEPMAFGRAHAMTAALFTEQQSVGLAWIPTPAARPCRPAFRTVPGNAHCRVGLAIPFEAPSITPGGDLLG
jgi:hypothetical protein